MTNLIATNGEAQVRTVMYKCHVLVLEIGWKNCIVLYIGSILLIQWHPNVLVWKFSCLAEPLPKWTFHGGLLDLLHTFVLLHIDLVRISEYNVRVGLSPCNWWVGPSFRFQAPLHNMTTHEQEHYIFQLTARFFNQFGYSVYF